MNKSSYQKYLASRDWAVRKEQVRKRSKGKCERCKTGNYDQTHHVTYERMGHEKPEDLIALCSRCHEYISGKSNYDPRAELIATIDHFIDAINPTIDTANNAELSMQFIGEIRASDMAAGVKNRAARLVDHLKLRKIGIEDTDRFNMYSDELKDAS